MTTEEQDKNMPATFSNDRTSIDRLGDDSSDDDSQIVPRNVDNYWLEDGQERPISLSILPLHPEEENHQGPQQDIFLRGTTDSGLQRVYIKAEAWRLNFSKGGNPTFLIRTGGKHWVELLKPRKSYEEIIRSLLVVAQFLDFVQKNPDAPEKNVWNHLNEVFRIYEVKPSRSDLSPYVDVIDHYMKLERLENSTVLKSVISSLARKRTTVSATNEDITSSGKCGSDEKKSKGRALDSNPETDGEDEQFAQSARNSKIDDSMDSEEQDDFFGDDAFEEVGDLSEPVCSICDNGGNVLCCDGPCMRSFHLNKEAAGAEDSECSTLGFSKDEVERMEKYFCPNCQHKQHQCYACGELGRSDDSLGPDQEVFICDVAICGRFYHPHCAAKLVIPEDEREEEAEALAQSIKDGQGFSCPIHKCRKCGKFEVAEEEDLQFALCRRCPRAWHRKCLPSSILFEGTDDEPERAWEGLLPNNRILMYCKRHKIVPDLGTPRRDHVKFPGRLASTVKSTMKKRPESQVMKRKLDSETKVKREVQAKRSKPDAQALKSKPYLDSPISRIKLESEKRDSQTVKRKPDLSISATYSKEKIKPDIDSKGRTSTALAKSSKLGKDLLLPIFPKVDTPLKNREKSLTGGKVVSLKDAEIRSTIDAIIRRSRESTTLESIIDKHDVPKCYQRSNKNPDKKYSLTKIESIVKAMRRAVETLDKGGSIEDAKTKCSGSFVKFLDGCKNELKVYLAPFLHGMRYTSFGRHFTKKDKLQEVVDRLQWYVQDGDMVVDMCCGANDFSIIMRDKMAQIRKKCSFKNFDIIQPKNDFNFEKRDWFQVKEGELPNGSRLIMGLNPPFGVKGKLANDFINHALKFKPKLIILIVPKETERLDRKAENYNLIWEDPELLKGESFYLPGSVDVNENPLSDWNAVPPPLYLWSRPDWIQSHREIAQQRGHISRKSIADPSPRFAGDPWKMHFHVPVSLPPPLDSRLDNRLEKQRSDLEKRPIEPASTGDIEFESQPVAVTEVSDPTSEPADVAASREEVDISKQTNAEPIGQGGVSSLLVTQTCTVSPTEKASERGYQPLGIVRSPSKEHRESTYTGDKESNGREDKGKRGNDNSKLGDREDSRRRKGKHDRNTYGKDKQHDKPGNRDRFEKHADIDMHDRHDDRERHEQYEPRARHEGRDMYDDRDKHERYEPRARNDNREKHFERRKKSPDRYGHRTDAVDASGQTHTGRDVQQMDDSSRYPVSHRESYDDTKHLEKRGRLEKDAYDDSYHSVGAAERSMQHYDWRRPEREDLRNSQWNATKPFRADQGLEMLNHGAGSEGTYRSREFNDLDRDARDKMESYEKESLRRRELIDIDAQRREATYLPRDYPDRDVRDKMDTYEKESQRRRELIDIDAQRREATYLSRDYPEQVAGNAYEGDYSDRDVRGLAYMDRAYPDVRSIDSHVLKKYGDEFHEPELNVRQRNMDYRDFNLQARERVSTDYGEPRSQGVSSFGLENSYLERNYKSSDVLGGQLGGLHELRRSNDWQREQHEPYQPNEPSAFLHGNSNNGPLGAGWASNQGWQYPQLPHPVEPLLQPRHGIVDPLLQRAHPLPQHTDLLMPHTQSYLGVRHDITSVNLPSHAPYGGGGRYGESHSQFSQLSQAGWLDD